VTPGVVIEIPGREAVRLRNLVLDVNGTITRRGDLIEGVAERLASLRGLLDVHLVSADTYGTLPALAETLGVRSQRVQSGAEKVAYLEALGPNECAMIGNGANDAGALQVAAIAVCVVGPEGAAPSALGASDLVARSVVEALDLLLEPKQIAATLRP
jgi:soluble P-type ATPase